MKLDWKTIGKFAVAAVSAVVPAVGTVESIVEALIVNGKAMPSQEKQDMALLLVKKAVEATEGVTGKDLLNDPEVAVATKGIIDAVVSFKNLLAKKAVAADVKAALGVAGSTGE